MVGGGLGRWVGGKDRGQVAFHPSKPCGVSENEPWAGCSKGMELADPRHATCS